MTTRRPPISEVYQDPDASFTSRSDHEVETALLHALGPLGDASNRANIALTSTTAPSDGSSPRKIHSSPRWRADTYKLSDVRLSPPPPPIYASDSLNKNADFYDVYHHVAPMPAKMLYPGMPSMKENEYDATSFGDLPVATPYEPLDHAYNGPMKRAYVEAGPDADLRMIKRPRYEEEELFDLPEPKDMPAIVDDGSKPSHSYATLIGMAILRAPQRRLTLAQIYKWISDHYSFYRSTEAGWQNSIRHNLSLNKNFIKRERPKDDPGKGNYWAIKPGQEKTYITDRKNSLRRLTNPDGSQYVHAFPHDLAGYRPATAPAIGQFTLAPGPTRRVEPKTVDSAKFPDDTELSSDGTIPGSDAGLNEDDHHDSSMMPPPPAPLRSSPPPQEFGSSPPAMSSSVQRGGTPPPAPRFLPTSTSGGRKRKFAGLNDSGYWSSIESSAARGAAHQLTSEADIVRPRVKKGRAEEEIARIRSCSFDSPSKKHRRTSSAQLPSSSPSHREDNPLTPGLVFKRPPKPPPSISPNTNLRNHRNRVKALLGSPVKTCSPLPENVSWSPALNFVEDASLGLTPGLSPFKTAKTPWKLFGGTPSGFGMLQHSFDVFTDFQEDDLLARGSPEKRPTKRPSLVRAATSAGILADVTGTSKGNVNATSASPFSISPFISKPAYLQSPSKLVSPLKQGSVTEKHDMVHFETGIDLENVRPSDLIAKKPAQDVFGAEFPSDGSEEMIDIFQDFGKIGQARQLAPPAADRSLGSPVKRSMGPPARPALNRSHTSRW
ncbi:hypothetical protein AMS68_005060 [Peltaster fructicola]|uniref:Fork-head domain-containing protein n=1 Tax=Peltaster fructicola TaxID=286661 RepID=A0A6H0XXR2_9PEZI|nr:hypothetical protein AMS68_005060 [Peltaster fructicola]